MGNLDGNDVYAWTPDDRKVSDTMSAYFANFVKSGNPNADGLPAWPALPKTGSGQVMHIDVESHAAPDTTRPRYLLLDQIFAPLARPTSTR